MDELKRTDWDKVGKYRSRNGPDYVSKYRITVKSLPDANKVMPDRCRARNCRGGFYFDPVTFAVTETSTRVLFADPESSEKDNDTEVVDEV